MKNVKYLVALFATLIVVTLTIVACNKISKENECMSNQDDCEMSELYEAKDVGSDRAILENKSFKTMIRTSTKLMGLFVESKVTPDCFVFDDVGVLCQQLGVPESDLLHLYDELIESMEKLVDEYGVRGDEEDCPLCSMSEAERVQYFRDLISLFRDNPEVSYDLEKYYVIERTPDGGDDFGPCERPVLAMICITVCVASSAEVPPIMALCCYACICSYCPNNPLCVKIDSFSVK